MGVEGVGFRGLLSWGSCRTLDLGMKECLGVSPKAPMYPYSIYFGLKGVPNIGTL